MSSSLSHGILTISIDVETAAAPLDLREGRTLAAMVDRLLEILAAHQVPATWALADPATSMFTASIQSRRAGHEIAIASDASWAGPIIPRVRFGRELAARANAGRAAGLNLSSLVAKAADLGDHYDLVVKQGLTAVRHGHARRNPASRRRVQLATPRFGLWSFGVSCWLPGDSLLWPGGGRSRMARQVIDRSAHEPALIELAVDARQLIERGAAALRVVDRVVEHAAWRRRDGQLDIVTLAAAASRLTAQCTSTPSRSILRPAA